MSGAKRGEAGFTLVEMLVALTIFSLAALALVRLQGVTILNAAQIDAHGMAQIVAANVAAEALTDPVPPAFGEARGETDNGGRRWRWMRTTRRSPEARIQRIDIVVEGRPGAPAARLTVFRSLGS